MSAPPICTDLPMCGRVRHHHEPAAQRYLHPVSIPWKSPFHLDLPERAVADVRDQVRARRRGGRSGLRGLRVRGDQLRARYVIGDAMSAPLLRARLIDTERGTRLDGEVSWGAVYYGALLHVAGLALLGLISVGFTVSQHAWQPLVLGVFAFALSGVLGVIAVRGLAAQRHAYANGFEDDLRTLFESPPGRPPSS